MCQANRFVDQHLEFFRTCLDVQEQWTGGSPRLWTTQITDGDWNHLPVENITRQQLKELCRNSRYSNEDCIFAIMAWGGLNRRHGRRLANNVQHLTNIVTSLRNETMSATDAYTAIYQIIQGAPIGIRPAYYTKLIFFLDPNHSCYIMDQWTAKSINLLRGTPVVRLQQGHVSNLNTAAIYNVFCQEIRYLANLLEQDPEHIEMALFSEGRNRGRWRQYVVNNWTP